MEGIRHGRVKQSLTVPAKPTRETRNEGVTCYKRSSCSETSVLQTIHAKIGQTFNPAVQLYKVNAMTHFGLEYESL